MAQLPEFRSDAVTRATIPAIDTSAAQAQSRMWQGVGGIFDSVHKNVGVRLDEEAKAMGKKEGMSLTMNDLSRFDAHTTYNDALREATVQSHAIGIITDAQKQVQSIAKNGSMSYAAQVTSLQAAYQARIKETPEEAHKLLNQVYITQGIAEINQENQERQAKALALSRLSIKDQQEHYERQAIISFGADAKARREATRLDVALEDGKITPQQHAEQVNALDQASGKSYAVNAEAYRATLMQQVKMGIITEPMAQNAMADLETKSLTDMGIGIIADKGPLAAADLRASGAYTEEEVIALTNKGMSLYSQKNNETERLKRQDEEATERSSNNMMLTVDDALIANDRKKAEDTYKQFHAFALASNNEKRITQDRDLRKRIDDYDLNGGKTSPAVYGQLDNWIATGVIKTMDDIPEGIGYIAPGDKRKLGETFTKRDEGMSRSPYVKMGEDLIDQAFPLENRLSPIERAISGQKMSNRDMEQDAARTRIKLNLNQAVLDGQVNSSNYKQFVNEEIKTQQGISTRNGEAETKQVTAKKKLNLYGLKSTSPRAEIEKVVAEKNMTDEATEKLLIELLDAQKEIGAE